MDRPSDGELYNRLRKGIYVNLNYCLYLMPKCIRILDGDIPKWIKRKRCTGPEKDIFVVLTYIHWKYRILLARPFPCTVHIHSKQNCFAFFHIWQILLLLPILTDSILTQNIYCRFTFCIKYCVHLSQY